MAYADRKCREQAVGNRGEGVRGDVELPVPEPGREIDDRTDRGKERPDHQPPQLHALEAGCPAIVDHLASFAIPTQSGTIYWSTPGPAWAQTRPPDRAMGSSPPRARRCCPPTHVHMGEHDLRTPPANPSAQVQAAGQLVDTKQAPPARTETPIREQQQDRNRQDQAPVGATGSGGRDRRRHTPKRKRGVSVAIGENQRSHQCRPRAASSPAIASSSQPIGFALTRRARTRPTTAKARTIVNANPVLDTLN